MKKILISAAVIISATIVQAFDFGGLVNEVSKTVDTSQRAVNVSQHSARNDISVETVTDGLKQALGMGVDYAIDELNQPNGYFNNSEVKIPLPPKLQQLESIIRSAGGGEMADNLVLSMNTAASQAAGETAEIFYMALDNMTIDDAWAILEGGNDRATQYFRENTTYDLKRRIKPIVQDMMEKNDVAIYYNSFNKYYKSSGASSSLTSMASSFGAGGFVPDDSDVELDDYITDQAIEGLFKMVAIKELDIRDNPIAQTSDVLKQVFGN